MASGSISGSTNNRYIVAQINWQASANVSGNYSDVSAQLFYRRTNSGYTTSGTISGVINIDGTNYGYSGRTSIGSGWVQVASASKRVYHNSDGTRSIWIGASGGISGTSFTSTSCGSGVNLDTIPRASGMGLSSYSIAAGDNVTVSIDAHNSSFSHLVDVYYCNQTKEVSVAAGLTSTSITLDKSWVTETPNQAGTWGRVRVTTKSGDTVIGYAEQKFTLTIPDDVKPSLTAPTLTDSTKAYSVLNAFAANYSKVTVATTASVYKDDDFIDTATISSVTANYNGQNYDASSGSFTFVPSTVGTSDMTIAATDSRGKTTTQTVSIPVAAYTRPTVTLSASRYADSAGTIADDTGAYAKVTAVCTLDTDDVTSNSATVTLKYKTVDGTDWDTVDLGTITAGSTLSTVIPASDTKAYTLTTTIADKIATTGATMALSNGAVPMDFLKGGKGIAIGKTATREGLDIAFPTYVEGRKVYVDGKTILDKFFPIGKMWISTDPTSPASIVGGSWEQIKDGVLFSAGHVYKKWEYLCDENASFTLTETSQVRYGRYDTYTYKTLSAGTYTANSALFGGDPYPGGAKVVDIYKSYSINAGDTGGEVVHELSQEEMPFHNHKIMTNQTATWHQPGYANTTWLFYPNNGTYANKQSTGNGNTPTWTGFAGGTVNNGNKPHNNMMPYRAVYMWRRIA